MRNRNKVLDKEIIERIKELTKNIKERVSYLRKDIDVIIRSKSKSHKQIESILDELLDYSIQGFGEKEFRKLNSYYPNINKRASEDYDKYYEEMAVK